MARWSPRVRIPVLGRLVTLNWGRRGASASLRLGPLTFNSRGGWSFNGPGFLDYRGKWRGTSRGAPRRVASRGGACGARWNGGAPCTHPAGHLDAGTPHQPREEAAWAPAWTRGRGWR